MWLRVENGEGRFKPGTAVHAAITGRTAKGAVLIPAGAVQTGADGTAKTVMVMAADGTAHRRAVKLGIETAKTVEVLDGISPTDMVITTGAYGLDDGTKVRVAKPGAGDLTDGAEDDSAKKDAK